MAKRRSAERHESFAIELDGKTVNGSYSYSAGLMTVYYAGYSKTARPMGSNETTVRMLVREIQCEISR